MPRVVIVGGGFTGLAAAHSLCHSRSPARESVTLLEQGPRLGGKVFTERHDGFVVEGGADSWLAAKGAATRLAKTVGLEGEMIGTRPENRRVYVAWTERMHPLPEGVVLGVPTRVWPMVETGLFSWRGKLRMAIEPLVRKRGWEGSDDDESIADFFTRRLGREASERLAAPLLGGIYAGDARELSVRTALPQFVEAERMHGSLVRAMRAQARANKRAREGSAPASAFVSLRAGMGAFVDAIVASLPAGTARTGVTVKRIARLEASEARARGRWAVELDAGETLFADDVILAMPPSAAATALRSIDSELATFPGGVPVVSTAAVAVAMRRHDIAHPLDATGYIVPRVLGHSVVAATWVSSKWEGRAPEGTALVRVFLGGGERDGRDGREDIADHDDADLVRLAKDELTLRIGAKGDALFSQVFRFRRASPQPLVGHHARLRAFRERLARWPGLHVGGGGFESVGVPACIEQGEQMAASVLAR